VILRALILVGAVFGCQPKPGPSVTGPRRDVPSRADLQADMHALRAEVQACYDRCRESGQVDIQVTIAPSGRPTQAQAVGQFAGTPTGTCIAEVVKRGRFTKFSNPKPITITYPFILR